MGCLLILDPSPEDEKWDWLDVGCKPIFELGGTFFWNCLDWKQVRCNSQRKTEALDLGMRTDAGWEKAADSMSMRAQCTAQHLAQKEGRGSLRVRGFSYSTSALPRLQRVLSLAEKAG